MVHKINTKYSNNLLINTVFYTFIILFLVCVYYLFYINRQKASVFIVHKKQSWISAYSVILFISLLLFLVMSWFKSPKLLAFELFPMYFIWALFQQVFLGVLLADKIFYKNTQNKFLSSLFAASIFALFHLPSMTLVLATLIAGFLWSYAWLTYKRILPLALSHTVLALMLYYVIPDRIWYSARVFQWFRE